jgi:TPR repeat protein
MTANDAVPPIRLDRYLALLALLLAIVLAFVVLGERQKAAIRPTPVTGALPPPPDPRLAALAGERDRLLTEQARLADGLATAEHALAAAEADIERLKAQVDKLERDLSAEVEARAVLERRLAEVAAERDRLATEVQALTRIRESLEAELAALAAATPIPPAPPSAARQEPPAAPAPEPTPAPAPAPAVADLLPGPDIAPEAPGPAVHGPIPPAGESATGDRPGRLVILDGRRTGVADGIKAYQAGEYDAAARIWGKAAAEGEARAQFHLGSLLFEGRTGPPDLVMAYVWLSRAVTGGHLPAIEVRRRVRAAMTEAQYEAALAILEAG